ncbi:Chitinase 2, variant 3 [Chamberlinius hualienensis]
MFVLESIDTSLCTHGMYTFAGLDPVTNRIISLDPYNDLFVGYGLGGYIRFTNLAKKNPNFIPMLSVGGWNEGSVKYSHMASSVEFRKAFIDSALEFLDMYGFKGLDLDWEYPTQRGGRPEDKDNFILLLKELKEAFQPYGYLLSAAVSAGKTNIDAAYDIPSISNYLDLINLMSYDYHGDWEPYTGLNAPLYARPDETEGNKTLNVNFSVNYWIASGAPANKINLGLGTYGRTFSLADPRVHGFYAPVYGPGEGGPYTEEAGDLGYNEISCD